MVNRTFTNQHHSNGRSAAFCPSNKKQTKKARFAVTCHEAPGVRLIRLLPATRVAASSATFREFDLQLGILSSSFEIGLLVSNCDGRIAAR